MKNVTLIISALLLSVFCVNAQDTMYVMKNGTASHTIPVTAIDSIIFYAPTINPPPPSNCVSLGCTAGTTDAALSTVTSDVLNADFTGAYFDGNVSKEFNTGPGTGTSGSIASMDWTWVIGSASWGGEGSATVTCNNNVTITPTGNQNFEYDVALLYGFNATQGQSYTIEFEASSTQKKYISTTIRTCNGYFMDKYTNQSTYNCGFEMHFTRTAEVGPTTKKYQFQFVYGGATGFAQLFIRVGGDNVPITIDNLKIGKGQLAQPATSNCKINILPIGDSISQGGSGENQWTNGQTIMYGGTYRQELYYKLKSLGYNVNMIGNMKKVAQSNTDDPYNGVMHLNGDTTKIGGWDTDCEAYWGETTTELLNHVTTNSSSWGAIPDIALIHIGTNNLLVDDADNTAKLQGIVDHLRTVNPCVKIFLAKILPIWEKAQIGTDPIVIMEAATKVTGYNNNVIPAVAATSTANSPITVVDMTSALTYPTFTENAGILKINNRTDWEDPFHPTQFGAYKMSRVWLNAIQSKMPF